MEDALLFLYNPQSHQWSLNAAASNDGTIGQFSDDGGKTWESNFVAMLTREKQ
jgi:hypothetical protein